VLDRLEAEVRDDRILAKVAPIGVIRQRKPVSRSIRCSMVYS
jgi:hypothetical protein